MQIPPRTCSALSSSDDESYAYTHLFMMSNNGLATLVHNNGKRPTITLGMMTVELLHCFKHFAHGYLANKENLAKAEYVAHIAYVFEDPLFSDWFQTSQSYYKKLSFTEFMTQVCTRWLTAGWKKELICKVHNTKQGVTPSVISLPTFAAITCCLKTQNIIFHRLNFAPRLKQTYHTTATKKITTQTQTQMMKTLCLTRTEPPLLMLV